MRGGRFFCFRLEWVMRALGDGRQHVFFAINQRGRIVAGVLESVPVRNGIGGASFHAVAAEDAARIIDVVDAGVALAAADPERVGVLTRFDIDAVGWASGGA